jgi:hypothetical protein
MEVEEERRRGMGDESSKVVNRIKVHYMCIWQHHDEAHYSVQFIICQ